MPYEFYGRAIKSKRQAAGLRVEDIATRTGLSYSACWAIETGARSPNVHSVSLIANALGVHPSDFFAWREASS